MYGYVVCRVPADKVYAADCTPSFITSRLNNFAAGYCVKNIEKFQARAIYMLSIVRGALAGKCEYGLFVLVTQFA